MVWHLSEMVLMMTFVWTQLVNPWTDFILQGTMRNMASPALLFLHWTFCTHQAFPRGVCPRSSEVHCLSCSDSSKHLFLLTKDAYFFYSCELLLTSTASQEFDKITHSIMLRTRRFSATLWACKRRLMVMPSMPQWLRHSEFAGQRLAGRTHSSVVHCHLTYYTVHHSKIQQLLRTISRWF